MPQALSKEDSMTIEEIDEKFNSLWVKDERGRITLTIMNLIGIGMILYFISDISILFAAVALLHNAHYALLWTYRLIIYRQLNESLQEENPPLFSSNDFLITTANRDHFNRWFYHTAFFTLAFGFISTQQGLNTWSISILGISLLAFGVTWILISSAVRHLVMDARREAHEPA
jgi:hypothetical protein